MSIDTVSLFWTGSCTDAVDAVRAVKKNTNSSADCTNYCTECLTVCTEL